MEKALLIAEKPSFRRQIEAAYKAHKSEIPYDISFAEQKGHLLTLKMPGDLDEILEKWKWDTLPINPEEYGGWKYKIIPEKKVGNFLTSKEYYDKIKKELETGSYDFVIHAGDSDQEGELLVKIVLKALKNKLPVKRFWINNQTEEELVRALKDLKDDDNDPAFVNLYHAAVGRQHSDWRVGINLSRAATLKTGIRVACGRVKTPMLAIVCKREKEIQEFTPKTVYGVEAIYNDGFSGQLFSEESVVDDDGKERTEKSLFWFDTKEEAENVINKLSYPAKVVSYKKERKESLAPKLFKLSTAQMAAGKMGYSSGRTLELIQGLYEKGLISYPRTDCEYISSNENFKELLNSAGTCPDLAKYVFSIDESAIGKVRATKKWVNDAALGKASHAALTPTTKKPNFDDLSKEEQDIYTMICRQFVAIFLPPLVQDKVELITDITGESFKSNGSTLVDAGYSAIFGSTFSDTEIPKYDEGDDIWGESFKTTEKTSTCPKRYTDTTLIQACDSPSKYLEDVSLKSLGKNLKVGTEATRTPIITELINKDKYLKVEKSGKHNYLKPTETGMAIYEALKGRDITKVDMTGRWELRLEDIRDGKLSLADFEKEMMESVRDMVKDIETSDIKPLARAETIGDCPKCGGKLIAGPKGFYCNNYKEGCKVGAFKMICDSPLKEKEFLSLIAGETIEKELKKGEKSWKQKLVYDWNDYKIQFVQSERKPVESKATDYSCPHCGEKVSESEKLFSCKCGFKFWKTVCGVALNKSQIDNFFDNGETGTVPGMKSKKGSTFSANIVYDESSNGTKFSFE